MDSTFQPFIREIRALLHEVGPDTVVFITADHGHYRREGGSPVYLDVLDVGYRSAWVPNRVEGFHAKHLFQIPAAVLRHGKPGFYVFPKPGFHLRSREGHGTAGKSDASYRHGGVSMTEVIVPIACLRHRASPTTFRLSVNLYEKVIVGKPAQLQVTVSADGVINSPVRLGADTSDVEPMMISGAKSTPETYALRYIASAPGHYRISLKAWLGENPVGESPLDVDVAPAPVVEDEAKIKLKKLWGND
jgi:hypothetical protein